MVTGSRIGRLGAELTARHYLIRSGVNAKLGGDDEGLDPHELLEAALTACTIMTVQMYANRKGWALDSIDVQVKVESEGSESVISRQIDLKGPLNPDERLRLLEIANKCPIHKLLIGQVKIQTVLAPSGT